MLALLGEAHPHTKAYAKAREAYPRSPPRRGVLYGVRPSGRICLMRGLSRHHGGKPRRSGVSPLREVGGRDVQADFPLCLNRTRIQVSRRGVAFCDGSRYHPAMIVRWHPRRRRPGRGNASPLRRAALRNRNQIRDLRQVNRPQMRNEAKMGQASGPAPDRCNAPSRISLWQGWPLRALRSALSHPQECVQQTGDVM